MKQNKAAWVFQQPKELLQLMMKMKDFMLSGGSMIGNNWGVDVVYYDMGDSTITVTSDDTLTINANFSVGATGGDITQNITGVGLGLITPE